MALQHEFFTPSGQTTRVTQYTNATSGADSGHGISLGGSAQGYAQRDYGRGTVASAPLTNQRRFPTADRRGDVNALLAWVTVDLPYTGYDFRRRLPSTKQKAMAVFGNVASTSRPSPPTRTLSVHSTPPPMAQNHRLSQAPSRVRTASIGTPTRNLLSTERGMTVSKTTETTLPTITTRRLKHNIQNADSRFIVSSFFKFCTLLFPDANHKIWRRTNRSVQNWFGSENSQICDTCATDKARGESID